MKKYFISYCYVGRVDKQHYTSFGNMFLLTGHDILDEEGLEYITNDVNEQAKKDQCMESITCTIMYFKRI